MAIELSFSGLPHRDRTWTRAAVVLALILVLGGAIMAAGGARAAGQRAETRDRLLAEIALLRRKAGVGGEARGQKERGQKDRARREARLMEQLRQVWEDPT